MDAVATIKKYISGVKQTIENLEEKIKRAEQARGAALTDREKFIYQKLVESYIYDRNARQADLEQSYDRLKDEKYLKKYDEKLLTMKNWRDLNEEANTEDVYQQASQVMQWAQDAFELSSLKDFISPILVELLQGRKLACIRVIGVGCLWTHMADTDASRQKKRSALQLAFVLYLKKLYPSAVVGYQEMRIHPGEEKWLIEQGVRVLPKDNLRIIPKECDFRGKDEVTLAITYFIGNNQNNLLFSYWHRLDNLLLISCMNKFQHDEYSTKAAYTYGDNFSDRISLPKRGQLEECHDCEWKKATKKSQENSCVCMSLNDLYIMWKKPDVEVPEIVEIEGRTLILD